MLIIAIVCFVLGFFAGGIFVLGSLKQAGYHFRAVNGRWQRICPNNERHEVIVNIMATKRRGGGQQ
jgi:hypothetical protein